MAHPCARRPLAVPDTRFALVLAAIQAIVLVPCVTHFASGIEGASLLPPPACTLPRSLDRFFRQLVCSRHPACHRAHSCAQLFQHNQAQVGRVQQPRVKGVQAAPCENLSRPPSFVSIALRSPLNTFQRYCARHRPAQHSMLV